MTIHKTILPNGLRVIVKEKRDSKTVALSITIGSGSNSDGDEYSGISHFIEHMLFKGTKKRTAKQIVTEIGAIGGYINAATSQSITRVETVVPAEHFNVALDVAHDVITNPAFKSKAVSTERNVILEEIRVYKDTPTEDIIDILPSLLYKKHPVKNPILGSIKTVSALTRNKLIDHFKKNYVASNMVVSIVGNISVADAVTKVRNKFSSTLAAPKPLVEVVHEAGLAKPVGQTVKKKLEQAHIAIGIRLPTMQNPDWVIADFIACYLEAAGMMSRLYQELRDKGLVYDVRMEYLIFADYGQAIIYAGTEKNNVNCVKNIILRELARLKTKKLPLAELNKFKACLKGHKTLHEESNKSMSATLGWYELASGVDAYEKYFNALAKITAEDVQRVAKQYFNNKYAILIYLPED